MSSLLSRKPSLAGALAGGSIAESRSMLYKFLDAPAQKDKVGILKPRMPSAIRHMALNSEPNGKCWCDKPGHCCVSKIKGVLERTYTFERS